MALKGQSSAINSVAFAPDGLSFLTGSFGSDPSARLWDLKGKLLKVFKGHTTSIFSIAFSSDGKKILTGSADQTAILWSSDGTIDQFFSGYKSYVRSVAFSPDGQSVLTGLDDGSIRLYPVKMSYNNYKRADKYEKLSSFDNLLYNLTDISKIRSSTNEKDLQQAAEYYINEAIQSGTSEKIKYLNYAVELYTKLSEENPEKKEYLLNLLKACVYSYEANPNEQTKGKIAKINDKILSFSSTEDLTLICYTYCLMCAKNDTTVTELGITYCYFRICNILLSITNLPLSQRKDISKWCSYLASDFIQKKEFSQALQSIREARLSDSTNIEINLLLPIAYIFNNQYDKAEVIIKEFKDKPLNGIDNFTRYSEVYKHSLELLEDRAIIHPDLARVKELLKN
jgi:hypothetical protein